MKRLKAWWQALFGDDSRIRATRLLGLLFIVAGFVVIGFAWEGSASINFAQGQIPYLLSGGATGIGLIVVGCVLLLLAAARADRQEATKQFEEMNRLLGRNLARLGFTSNGSADGGQVVPGANVYHRPECSVLEGKENLTSVSVGQAAAEGLNPCRVCNPPPPPVAEQQPASAVTETPGP